MNQERTNFSQEKEATPKSFDTIAQELITNKELSELEGPQRALVIADRFIGSIVRHGEVKGASASYSPAEVLEGMDYISKAGVSGLKEITRTEGLREAVRDLSLDEDVAKLFGSLSSRLSQDEEGKYTLTSAAQVEGYLLAGGNANIVKNPVGGVHMPHDTWIPVILEQTQRMASNPNLNWLTTYQARELTTSSSDYIRNGGNDWLKATTSAEKVGVDVQLLGRSAERIQERHVRNDREMGSTALFLATGGSIKQYSKSLDSRSGMR